MKYLWSSERPTRPARPPTSPCQAVPRSHWEAATAWPLRAPPQARTLGSEFCLQVAFLLVLGLTAGLSRTYLKNLTQKPRGKIHSVCPETDPSKRFLCEMCASLVALGQSDHPISSFSNSCSFKSFEDLLNLWRRLGKLPGSCWGSYVKARLGRAAQIPALVREQGA